MVGRAEQAAVLALTKVSSHEWYRTAAVISDVGSAVALLRGRVRMRAEELQTYAEELVRKVRAEDVTSAEEMIARVEDRGARLLTVLDEGYPANLQLVYNQPPFIWVRGDLRHQDGRSVAVVGTRQASDNGLTCAARLARGLAEAGVTVVSGLARGIDTAAHQAALDVPEGRTVAVVGHGLLVPAYPPENRDLADQISRRGAVVSQFWPDAPPQQRNFPMRNVVMSGLAMGTVVVEASSTSGAKMQARIALEHGKQLFLMDSLVESQEWARRYASRPAVRVVSDLDEILDVLTRLSDTPEQLMLQL